GRAPKEIIKFLKLPKTTVYRVAQEFNESKGNATPLRKTQDQFRSKKITLEFLHELQERINDDPGTSIRDLAAKMNSDVSKTKRVDRSAKPLFWSKEMWPPSSPVCNPLDYYMWGVMERVSNKCALNNVVSLKPSIGAPCQRLQEVLVQAGGGHRG
ncbi:Uncharacterized protein FKW44_014935, partial [Caligus rogercresseyi]